MLRVFFHRLREAVVDDAAHLGAFFRRKAVDAGMRRREHLHVDAVLPDRADAEIDVEELRRHRPGLGAHADDDLLALGVGLDAHIARRGFELFQIGLGINMAMKVDVHGHSLSVSRRASNALTRAVTSLLSYAAKRFAI